MLSHDAYWDDISITYETRRVKETSTIGTLPQETPTTQVPSTQPTRAIGKRRELLAGFYYIL